MELSELIRLKKRCCVGLVIENRKGQVFKSIAKDWNSKGEDVFLFRQTNTEEVPIEFWCTYQQFSDACEQNKIFGV